MVADTCGESKAKHFNQCHLQITMSQKYLELKTITYIKSYNIAQVSNKYLTSISNFNFNIQSILRPQKSSPATYSS